MQREGGSPHPIMLLLIVEQSKLNAVKDLRFIIIFCFLFYYGLP